MNTGLFQSSFESYFSLDFFKLLLGYCLRLYLTMLTTLHKDQFQRPFYSDGAGQTLQRNGAFGVTNFHNILILHHFY